ncbi:hypothetical protein [Streptomyces cinerochromogenes]|uniref:hypothetical protein n=1 Tax=Streptomyces cinerochromogenes TaxID=66422 RepID=UPI0019CDAA92|nr:hypothetical protein [Streptomyces cinerochromogenes]GGS43537.1 hypothetical protein GCM10010206_00980 [Streptomyces cinerochromogenes]
MHRMYREFLAPGDEEVLEATGKWPDTDEGGARVLTWCEGGGESLVLSYDVLARSVRVRWSRGGEVLLDVFRESATRLSFTSGPSARQASVDFHMGACAGVLEVQVAPHFSVRDRLLFR